MEEQQPSLQRAQPIWQRTLIGLVILVIIVAGGIQIVPKFIRQYKNSYHSPITPTIFRPVSSPFPTSTGAIQNEFYSPETNTTKQIKAYEIVIENGTISTDMIAKDREHDTYFVNKDPSIVYSLEIYKDDSLVKSTVLSPRQVYSTALADIGFYSFKILENGTTKFEGKIYVQ